MTLATITILLLVGLLTAECFTVDKNWFNENSVVYTGENEITKISVPMIFNSMKNDGSFDLYVFFIEAQKGLYVLKNQKVTKLFANGADVAESSNGTVYLAATDGIYTFNAEKNTAEKYGSLTDNVISIAVANGTQEIYIITKDKVLFKVTDEGNSKVEITEVKDAVDMVFDLFSNLYFVDTKKQVFVRSHDGNVTKVTGLPENPSVVKLFRGKSYAAPIFVDDKVYVVNFDGTTEFHNTTFSISPTAVSFETCLFHLARNKKIYKYGLCG
ncbi:uncharacterized protein LOC114357431 [Ostrinia furnacalis]|uniref:uncharacterized protein LOC114357431 n=1 Tax=Ostrinia furnacalis TaxID=93504 RepID=UPI00103A7B27|nr:uncharacterized protein LOC114357431 [Ostrinia furnacalis]